MGKAGKPATIPLFSCISAFHISAMSSPILELRDVHTHFPVTHGFLFQRHLGTVKAVDGVTLSLARGEVLGLVGESGCGKSTLARTIVQLLPAPSGAAVLEGKNLTSRSAAAGRGVP